MLAAEQRVPQVRQLIDQEQYFVVHAPRQTGKTTCFRALAETLTFDTRSQAGPLPERCSTHCVMHGGHPITVWRL